MTRALLTTAAAVVAVTLGAAAPAAASPTIALIDTGIAPAHQEFAPGQLVGFWDFTRHLPAPGQAWDTAVAPYDPNGHGTATASMAAGLNASPLKSPSLAPGFPLAMAKVFRDGTEESVGIAAAVRWAVDTIGADVINVSLGSIVPVPGAVLFAEDYEALAYARARGVLVVAANGNGVYRTNIVPGDGASSIYSSSPHVLAVGAANLDSLTTNWQPEVAAAYIVGVPAHDTTSGYREDGGTSFGSPLVAGFAARLIADAQAAGRPLPVDGLETLIKTSARDTVLPPVHEGYGVVDAAQLPAGLAHARAGTSPARPSPDLNALWVEQVAGAERSLAGGRPPTAVSARRR